MLIPYIRRSRKDEEVVSIQDQTAAVLEWGLRNGVELARPVIDRGVSGNTSWRERELGEIVERCKRGEADGVIVAYFSRLTREKNSATWDVLEELEPLRLVSVREGIDSPPGEAADWNQAIQGFQANTEYKTLAKHLKSGKHATYEAGAYVNGLIPAGYDSEPLRNAKGEAKGAVTLVRNDDAAAIARAFSVKANGGSWAEVARVLRGVQTARGETRWSTQAARALAKNPIYMGVLRCTCGCGEHKDIPKLAIVTPSTWKKAQPKPGQKVGRKDRGKALLAGLLVCGNCKRTMSHGQTTVNGKRYSFYRCRGGELCDKRSAISALPVETFVSEQVFELFVQRGAVVGHEPDVEKLATLEHAETAAEAWLGEVVKLLEPGDPGAAEKLTSARAARDNAAAAALAERESQVREVDPKEWRAAWAVSQRTGDVEGPRRLMRDWLDGVIITKATTRSQPVEDRVEFLYKR